MAASSDLYDTCRELLDAATVALNGSPAGVPARRFVSAGLPAFDCSQLSVHVGGATPGLMEGYTAPVDPPMVVGLRTGVTAAVNLVQMTITVVRCIDGVPDDRGNPPSPVKLDNDAQKTLADLWVIWNSLRTQKLAGTLYPPEHRFFFFDPALALPISGGMAGWQIPTRVQLDGYRTS